MKVIQVPFCFYPDPVGGTEVFVEALAGRLQASGIQGCVAAPGERDARYTYKGLRVRRFAVSSEIHDLRDIYGGGDRLAAAGFGTILDAERPDLVHLHAFTRGVSLRLIREAKQRDIAVIFTYHTPTISCQRGTLMRWGSQICDGVLKLHTCSRCTLHSLGLSRRTAQMVGSLPTAMGSLLRAAGLSGGLWTALRMTELMQHRYSAFRTLMAEVNRIVAVCEWGKDLLLRNGVLAEKITVSHYGITHMLPSGNGQEEPLPPDYVPLRIAYLGRLDPTKGPDMLIRAIRSLPEVPVELHLYGIVQDAAGEAYLQHLKALATGDPRIAFLPTVSNDRIVSLLKGYHLLAVPSRWLETGPLVVLEAFAAGIPVIGSNLGGIAELVEHEVNGLLVEPDSLASWCHLLRRFSEDRALLMQLRTGIRPPRGMSEVAEEMVALYRSVLQQEAASALPSQL